MDNELRRLRHGPEASEPHGIYVYCRDFVLDGDAPKMLARMREVLEPIFVHDALDWPTHETWHALLPKWLMDSFVAENDPRIPTSANERRTTSAKQRAPGPFVPPTPAQRAAYTRDLPWCFSVWLSYWPRPDRDWRWWNMYAASPTQVIIELMLEEPMTLSGAMEHLFVAAGAEGFDFC